jgi:hypothetical protein
MIQLIDKQGKIFYMEIYGASCSLIGIDLYIGNSFIPLPPKIKGSVLHWYVNSKYVSYNQLKKAIAQSAI